MFEQFFSQLLSMSITSSFIILIVIMVRFFLKKYPKHISYMLWSVVLFRLLCPISFPSIFSILPDMKVKDYLEVKMEKPFEVPDLSGEEMTVQTPDFTDSIQQNGRTDNEIPFNEKKELLSTGILEFCKYIWFFGMGIMLLFSWGSYLNIMKKVTVAVPFTGNVYLLDECVNPFVLGIINTRIYIPNSLDSKNRQLVIHHEKTHIRRFDHISKLLYFIALCIHWMNPLVWISFILFCNDMEMSCDESVVRKLGVSVAPDYVSALLLIAQSENKLRKSFVAFGEGDIKARIKNLVSLQKEKKRAPIILVIGIVALLISLALNPRREKQSNTVAEPAIDLPQESGESVILERNDAIEETESLRVSLSIEDYYSTNIGDPSNLYYIDDSRVLWGCGRNNCGQLSQGSQDYDFHSDMVKIAEKVVHVDYSQRDFMIYLTEDNKLYGVGNAGSGALQQYDSFDWNKYLNGEKYSVNEPFLLMENVLYAKCGRDDVVALKKDGTVWTWGTISINGGYLSSDFCFISSPEKILENAILVTGGWFSHAALLQDGTVWTWGYNSAGNCGVSGVEVVHKPVKVAGNAVMVWTGSMEYNSHCKNIGEFLGVYPRQLNNTIIQKIDGTMWMCGENVGTEEKVIHGAEGNYVITCSSEFLQYQ